MVRSRLSFSFRLRPVASPELLATPLAIESHDEKHFTEVIPCCHFVIMTNCSRTEKQKKL